MVAIFCLRLAWGMIAALLILPTAEVHPRFFRVQYLIALGLLAVAEFFLSESMKKPLSVWLLASLGCCIVGSIIWSLDKAPFAVPMLWITVACLTLSVPLPYATGRGEIHPGLAITNAFSAAALLGSSMSAMLMGHSYLVAPAMSLTPLMRLLAVMGISLVLRVILATLGLFQWMDQTGAALDSEYILWLSLRWIVGFVAVLILGWMAWESARIRSTQSATGILYVVVIVCFLGELASQFLVMKTGFIL